MRHFSADDQRTAVPLLAVPAAGRLHTLDGMRGLAAVAVVMGHSARLLGPIQPGHYWLAVDLFFLMSGVVLGRTYDPRLAAGLGVTGFMRHRYLRLMPLFVLALGVAVAGEVATILLGHSHLGWGGLLQATLAGLLLLPCPTPALSPELMPLNPPGWSLLFELAANLLFAAGWRQLNDRVLAGLVGLCGLVMILALANGPGLVGSHWDNWAWGLPRIGFSFFLGVLIQRYHPGPGAPSWWQPWALLAATALLLGIHPGDDLLFEGVALFLLLPLLTWAAMRATPINVRPFAVLGAISYPIYVLHEPIMGWLWRALLFFGRQPEAVAPWGGLLVIALAVVAAWAADRWLDGPGRRWLAERWPAPRRTHPHARPTRPRSQQSGG